MFEGAQRAEDESISVSTSTEEVLTIGVDGKKGKSKEEDTEVDRLRETVNSLLATTERSEEDTEILNSLFRGCGMHEAEDEDENDTLIIYEVIFDNKN